MLLFSVGELPLRGLGELLTYLDYQDLHVLGLLPLQDPPELLQRVGRELPPRDRRGVVDYPYYQESENFEYKVNP